MVKKTNIPFRIWFYLFVAAVALTGFISMAFVIAHFATIEFSPLSILASMLMILFLLISLIFTLQVCAITFLLRDLDINPCNSPIWLPFILLMVYSFLGNNGWSPVWDQRERICVRRSHPLLNYSRTLYSYARNRKKLRMILIELSPFKCIMSESESCRSNLLLLTS